jgi:hypothetical protein
MLDILCKLLLARILSPTSSVQRSESGQKVIEPQCLFGPVFITVAVGPGPETTFEAVTRDHHFGLRDS